MPDRVGVHEAMICVGLEIELGGTCRQRTFLCGLEVVDIEIEMHLHRNASIGPRWCDVIVNLLERDKPVGAADCCPVCASLGRAASDLGIEGRKCEGIRCVHSDATESDLVGHPTTVNECAATVLEWLTLAIGAWGLLPAFGRSTTRAQGWDAWPGEIVAECASSGHHHRQRERRPFDESSVAGCKGAVCRLESEIRDGRTAGDCEIPARVERSDRRRDFDRHRAGEPKRATDVFRMHDDLTQPRRGWSWRRSVAVDDAAKLREGLGGSRAEVVRETPIVVQIEVEAGTENAGDPSERADAGGRREVCDDLLDAPFSAQRLNRPLFVVECGEVVGESGALRMGGRPETVASGDVGHAPHDTRHAVMRSAEPLAAGTSDCATCVLVSPAFSGYRGTGGLPQGPVPGIGFSAGLCEQPRGRGERDGRRDCGGKRSDGHDVGR
jgi:hypothetical protein